MNKQERLELYDKCEKKWGKIAQYDQCIEEMAELTVAINKMKRKMFYGEYKNNPHIEENLIEEISDVKMCLEQLIHWNGEENIEKEFQYKLKKLEKYLCEI